MSFEERLIEEVKKNTCLYKKSSGNLNLVKKKKNSNNLIKILGGYKNISAKCRIWNEIASKLLSTGNYGVDNYQLIITGNYYQLLLPAYYNITSVIILVIMAYS